MSAYLQQSASTQTAMSPQMQRSLGQLQMSALDFLQEIDRLLDSNPLIDTTQTQAEDGEEAEPDNDSHHERLDWGGNSAGTIATASDEVNWRDSASQAPSLRQHLKEQIAEYRCTEETRIYAEMVIDSLDDRGYLTDAIPALGVDLALTSKQTEKLLAAWHWVRRLEPAGVAAADLGDCLQIQLTRLSSDANSSVLGLAELIIDAYLPAVAQGSVRKIAKDLNVSEPEIREAISLIRTLNPKPGDAFEQSRIEYVVPDLRIVKRTGRWTPQLVGEAKPRITVNEQYADAIAARADNDGSARLLKEKLREARWLVRSIEQRASTIELVGRAIVARQQAFFDYGDIALKPMTLAEIADEVDAHESTVSRVVNSKYMETSTGLIPFKRFFSSALSTNSGRDCSASAVKAMIRTIVEKEPPAQPVSDHQLAALLASKGINIARRTVSKYRGAIGIESLEMRRIRSTSALRA